jgi:membrane protease subunit (stomatin/prohibitin family)
MVISGLTDLIAEAQIPALDLAMNYDELSTGALNKLKARFTDFGFELTSFYIENLSLPPEVEKVMDKKTSMGVVGDINKYAQFQMADSIDEMASKNSSGGNFADMGVGMAMGNAMGNMFNQSMNNSGKGTPPPIPSQLSFHAVIDGNQAGPFDQNTLKQLVSQNKLTKETLVWRDGMANWDKAANIAELSGIFGSMPPPIPPKA